MSQTGPNATVLTPTEQQVVDYRLQGKTWREIGAAMGLSHVTVWEHGQKEHVRLAIAGEHDDIIKAAKERLAEGFRTGLDALVEVAGDKDHPQRIAAAKHLVGLVQASKVEHSGKVDGGGVTVTITPDMADRLMREPDD